MFEIIDLFKDDWALLTSGDGSNVNQMTISWGTVGFLWNKKVINVYVRPTRYTNEFMSKNDIFTVCFFDNKYKKDLNYLGSNSGRNKEKIKDTNLTLEYKDGYYTYKEAKITVVLKKIYVSKLNKEEFLDKSLLSNYPTDNFHYVYTGEILAIYE